MVELHIDEELLPGIPDVGVHAEGAIVLHDIEHDGLGGQKEVWPEVQHHYGLCILLHSQKANL